MRGPGSGSGAGRAALFAVVVFLWVAGSLLAGLGGDGWGHFALTRSLWHDRDVILDNNAEPHWTSIEQGPDGLVTHYPPGTSVMDLPAYAAGLAVGEALPDLARRVGDIGRRNPDYAALRDAEMVAVGALSAWRLVMGCMAVALIAVLLTAMGAGPRTAGAVAAIACLATPLPFYAGVAVSHAPCTLLTVAVVACIAGIVRMPAPQPGAAAVLGVMVAAAGTVRYVSGGWLPVALLAVFLRPGLRDHVRGRVAECLALLAGFAAVYVPQMIYWDAAHGTWWRPGDYKSFSPMRFLERGELPPGLNVLLSPRHGFLLWFPVHVLSLWGLVAAVRDRERRTLALACLGGVAVLALAHGAFHDWHGAGGWGQRYLTSAVAPLAIGLWWFLRGRGRGWWIAAVIACAWSVALLLQARLGWIHATEKFPWGETLADHWRGLQGDRGTRAGQATGAGAPLLRLLCGRLWLGALWDATFLACAVIVWRRLPRRGADD